MSAWAPNRRSREAASGANDQHQGANGDAHGVDADDDAVESGRATRFLAYSTGNKVVGLLRLGLDGNPAKVRTRGRTLCLSFREEKTEQKFKSGR